jgi:hypothetical protein
LLAANIQPVLTGDCGPRGKPTETHNERSETLFREPSWWLASDFWHPEQVVRSAIKDEQPAHFSSFCNLTCRNGPSCLSQPIPSSISHARILDAKVNKATQKTHLHLAKILASFRIKEIEWVADLAFLL